jgi:hypothetical protein
LPYGFIDALNLGDAIHFGQKKAIRMGRQDRSQIFPGAS